MVQQKEEKAGLENLSDEALAAIVEGAARKHGSDLDEWPSMADAAFRELARRSGEEV